MRHARRNLSVLLMNALVIAAGCGTTVAPPTEPSEPATAAPQTSEGNAAAAPADGVETADDSLDVSVDVKSWAEVEQLVAQHRGRVVVVDVWSTWCVPCLREFPHLVQLQQIYGGRVECVSVNIDYIGLPDEPPESFRDRVLEFLRSRRATLTNVISSDPDENVLTAIGVSSIPAVLIYDREGQLREKFTNDDQEYGDEGFTYQQHILPLVEKLLAP